VLLDVGRGEAFVFSAELIPNSKYSFLEEDPVVGQLLQKYEEQIAPTTRILGINEKYQSGENICQLVADLYCRKGVEKWGQTYDIVLGGGYISCRSPGYLSAGEVTYSQLYSLLPFDNEITLCSIKGRDLLDKFLQTHHNAYYITTTPYGETIRDSIDPNATYFVVTDSYSAEYAYNNMSIVETYSTGIFARDLLADYITKGGLA
jgi:2',3'-cyclic-nucleotide 2'-phosphodiesterase (5'-nucleotidase family)